MAVPVRLKSMPEHIRAQYGFPYSQVEPSSQRQQCIDGSQGECEDLQMLQFPKTKVILWDHTVTGPPVYLHFAQYRKPRICIAEKVLRIAHRQCVSCGRPMECVLVGTLVIDDDGEGLVFSIDRLDTRPSNATTLKNLAPGDVMVPIQISVNGSSRGESSVEDYSTAVKLLRQRCESKDSVDVCNFLLTKGWCNFYSRGDQAIAHLDFDVVTLNTVFKASPVSPVPIVPTALSKNLAGPRSISHVQGVPKSGYLTMDHTRKLLLVLESDPKVLNLPVVGMWVSGVTMVHHPFVWASCVRYIHNKMLQDRVCSPPEAFLLVLYSSLHSRPEFYECNTTTGNSAFNFDLFEGHEATNLNTSTVSLQNELVDCELGRVQPGKKREIFDAALATNTQDRSCESGGDLRQGGESGTVADDMLPRTTPAPHQSRMSAARPQVPEVSLYFADPPEKVPQLNKDQEHRRNYAPQDASYLNHNGSHPNSNGFYPNQNSSHPTSNGFYPNQNGIHPTSNGLYPNQNHTGQVGAGQRESVMENGHVLRKLSHSNASRTQLSLPHLQDDSQPSSLPPRFTSQHQQGARMVNIGRNADSRNSALQNGHLQHGRIEQLDAKQTLRHFHANGIGANERLQIETREESPNVPQSIPQRQLNNNQNCHHPNQPYPNTAYLPNGTLPNVETLPSSYMNSAKSHSGLPAPHSIPQGPPRPHGQIPQHPNPHPASQQCLSTSSSSSCQRVRHTLSSAFTPNPNTLSHQAPPRPLHPLHQQEPQAPQLVTGYPQEHLPGFVPQLHASYSSSQAHTESTCSGKSSDDSGLSVTPDRLNSSPKTASPKSPNKTTSSIPASSAGLDTINWEQVPPEIFQLIMAQNAQLQQLQAQMQQLLLQQSQSSPTTHTPHVNRTAESGIGVSPYSKETCETAVNTTLIYPSPESVTPKSNGHSVSLQTSPIKQSATNSPATLTRSHQGDDSSRLHPGEDSTLPSSSSQTPVEIRHKGALPLNSTQREDHEQGDITQGDLTAVVDTIALHNQTVDSVQSELILDMPSFQSSPTSRSQKDSGSLDGSYQTSPISASMCINDKECGSEAEGESGPVDEAYYEHLLGNIRHLLNSHSGGGESVSDQCEESVEDLQMKMPHSTQENTITSDDTSLHIRPGATPTRHAFMRNGADTTFIPRINYLSMMLDSDSDTSMEINAMALKYLTDDQLTQLGKLRKNTLSLPKQMSSTALLRKVLVNDTTISPDISQYGMSANNVTMGTQNYLEKYGLLNSKNSLSDETVTEESIRLKVDYSMATTPVQAKKPTPHHDTRSPSLDARSPVFEKTNSSSNSSAHSTSSSSTARSPIKKDFVRYSNPSKSQRKVAPTSPCKRISPPSSLQEITSPVLPTAQVQYEQPYNQHRYLGDGDSSQFQVFTSEADNILDIDKLRQMPKLL